MDIPPSERDPNPNSAQQNFDERVRGTNFEREEARVARARLEQKQRARYLRKLTAPICKTCYGLPHVACSVCPKGSTNG